MAAETARARLPRYGEAGLHRLVDGIITHVTAESAGATQAGALPLLDGHRRAILLVVDGLGRQLLDAHPDVAPTLAGQTSLTLDAPYPTSTVTSLTSLGTGLPPGEHGMVGYSTAVPHDDRPLVLLTWSWERQDLGIDARDDVRPEDFQPRPTAFERLRDRGLKVTTVLRPEFTGSGLTRAGLRGGEVVTATDLGGTLDAAVEATRRGGLLVYAHHGDLDTIGHVVGPHSDPWLEELARVDQHVADLVTRLPADTALVVTADHGMVRIAADGYRELADQPELLDGVRVLAGEPRARQLHTVDGAVTDVLEAWREATDGKAHVCSRDEAIAEGWFGGTVHDSVRPRIGDVLVTATAPDVAWVHRDADPFGGRLVGMHGALTPAEVEVPAIVLGKP